MSKKCPDVLLAKTGSSPGFRNCVLKIDNSRLRSMCVPVVFIGCCVSVARLVFIVILKGV